MNCWTESKVASSAWLFLAASVGVFVGSECRLWFNEGVFAPGASRTASDHLQLLINAPLLVPTVLLTPWSALLAVGSSVCGWRMVRQRAWVAFVLTGCGFALASFLNLGAMVAR